MSNSLVDFLGTQNITPDIWSTLNAGERGGILDSIEGLGGLDKANMLYGNGLDTGNGSWMDMLGGYKGIQGIAGLGQLGLGIMGYLDNKKTANLQRKLLGQQIDTNQFLLTQAKDRQGDIKNQFGGNAAGAAAGLAAQSQQSVPGVSATTVPSGAKNPFGSFGTTTNPYSKAKITM